MAVFTKKGQKEIDQALTTLRSHGFVVICWTPHDVLDAAGMRTPPVKLTVNDAFEILSLAKDALEDAERGWEHIEWAIDGYLRKEST